MGFLKIKKLATKKASEEVTAPLIDSVFYGDQPIQRSEEDIFGRSAFARNIAQSVAAILGQEPFAYGLSGPWGSGKTSLLYLVEHDLHKFQEGKKKVKRTATPHINRR